MQRIQPYVEKITGTGAAINVRCGFRPKLVVVLNVTQLAITFHCAGMADATALQIDDSGSNATDILSVGSAAITLGSQGFSIGTNSALNTSSDVMYAIAF